MLSYWARTLAYGLRHRRSVSIVFCENTHIVLGAILAKVIGKPCLWDVEGEDILYLTAWEKPLVFKALILTAHGLASRLVDLLLVPCDEDRAGYVSRGHNPERVITVPLSLDFSTLSVREEKETLRHKLGLIDSRTLLIYTGHRTEPPYREGAEWICNELAPALSREADGWRILLTGRGRLFEGHSSITFTGFVPNVFEYIAASDICLAPIWRETGTPGKLVEYMALAKPIVTTSLVRGFPYLVDGVNAMIARTKEEFVRKVLFLIQHPQIGTLIGAKAREAAIQHHSHIVVSPKLWEAVDRLLAARNNV
jgi:glycosyltransferase involved in cell wall biosynthesis